MSFNGQKYHISRVRKTLGSSTVEVNRPIYYSELEAFLFRFFNVNPSVVSTNNHAFLTVAYWGKKKKW